MNNNNTKTLFIKAKQVLITKLGQVVSANSFVSLKTKEFCKSILKAGS